MYVIVNGTECNEEARRLDAVHFLHQTRYRFIMSLVTKLRRSKNKFEANVICVIFHITKDIAFSHVDILQIKTTIFETLSFRFRIIFFAIKQYFFMF